MNRQRFTDDICRSVLARAHKKIVEKMDAQPVLEKLRDKGFLSHEDYIAIGKVTDKPTKNRSLLGKIKQSGKRAYCDFKNALQETGQTDILQELESKENELVTVENPAQLSEGRNRITQAIPERMETDQQPEPHAETMPNREQSQLGDLSRSVTIEKKIHSDLHDGRLIELNNNMVQELKRMAFDKLEGGFGIVYISKERVPGFNIPVVLKEIDLRHQIGIQSQTQKLGSVTNEKIASRLMHFGIVPLLAYHDDHDNKKYYLVSPYLANGDLFQAIATDRGLPKDKLKLKWENRIKIMYQIACAIDFMHTGNKLRGTVLHMDIKSKNIVLDAMLNARLIDFGIARELKDGDEKLLVTSTNLGTPGYFSANQQYVLTKNHDYYNFGVVLLELITGLEPSDTEEGLPLRQWHSSLIASKRQDSVWDNNSVVKKVVEIAVMCIESVTKESPIISYASITAESPTISKHMKTCFKNICRKQTVPEWEAIEGSHMCEICLVNEQMEVGFDGHENDSKVQTCSRRIRICCSCMRNSYINPVKCHTCGKTIPPFINANWGAILVSGYDEKDGKVFKKDIEEFKEVITSKVLPAMCINPQNVIILDGNMDEKMDDGMTEINADERIDLAFDMLSNTDIQTLLFVYSGHHDENGLDVGPNFKYTLDRICDKLIQWNKNKPQFGKVIVFLDCCYPYKMNLNDSPLKLIQLNATAPTKEANSDRTDGSPFLQNVMKAFTASANGMRCEIKGCRCSDHIQGKFITLLDLWNYLSEHKLCGNRPHMNVANIELKDTILAYNYKFPVQFEFTVEWQKAPTHTIYVLPKDFKTFTQLKVKLAARVLKNVYGIDGVGNDVIMSKFADIISIEINTGPKTKHVQEIDSIDLLRGAWISKRQLRCTDRILHNIDVDKPVGRCFMDVRNLRAIHGGILQKCKITENQLTRPKLLEYKNMLEKETKTTERKYHGYISALDMIIFQAEPQLQDNRLEIVFCDLPKGYTLVHMNLKKTAGTQETL